MVNANALTYDTRNCIIKGSPDKLIVVQGLMLFLVVGRRWRAHAVAAEMPG